MCYDDVIVSDRINVPVSEAHSYLSSQTPAMAEKKRRVGEMRHERNLILTGRRQKVHRDVRDLTVIGRQKGEYEMR